MTETISALTRIRANPGHLQSRVRDEAVVLLLDNGEYFGLNAVGVRVWALLQTERTFADLLAAVTLEYEVPTDLAHHDLVVLLEDLERFGLVELRVGP